MRVIQKAAMDWNAHNEAEQAFLLFNMGMSYITFKDRFDTMIRLLELSGMISVETKKDSEAKMDALLDQMKQTLNNTPRN